MKIAILHSAPEELRTFLEATLRGHDLFWLSEPSKVSQELEERRPEIVFSIKHSGFVGDFHAEALHFESVRWFQVGGSGVDHLGSWGSEKTVTNSAGVLAPFHAERAMAALLYFSTGLGESLRNQTRKDWKPTTFETLLGQTLLIVGYGLTGQELARRARAFGMKVLGVKRRVEGFHCPHAHQVFPLERLPELWNSADVLSVNVPLSAETQGLVGRSELGLLPRSSFLLNASRGGVVDQDALLEALDSGGLSGAWLDVTEPEPLPPDSPIWDHPKLLLTPHCADQVSDYALRHAHFFVENFQRYLRGEELWKVLSSNSPSWADKMVE